MREALSRLELRINAIKRAPMLGKAQAAELALEDALHLLGQLVEKVEQLQCDETPFGCGECDQCKEFDEENCQEIKGDF